jgi:hypothetical protein
VQRLDAPVHDLRKAGEVLDRADLETRRLELARRAAGRDELDAEVDQAAGELDDPALVRDGEQRAANRDCCGRGERRTALVIGLGGDGARISAA